MKILQKKEFFAPTGREEKRADWTGRETRGLDGKRNAPTL